MTGTADSGRATTARIYDYLLGGKQNFPADREAARQLLQALPQAADMAVSNRLFLQRAVRVLAEAGIRQFLDLGSGIPTQGNVHETAQSIAPDSRVLYVDIDPVAVVASNEILIDNPHCHAVQADLTHPQLILDALTDSDLATVIDLDQPTALIYCSVLHMIPDRVTDVVAPIRDRLVPGSAIVISHASADVTDLFGELSVSAAKGIYRTQAATEVTARTDEEIMALFGDMTLMPPGLVPLSDWRPELSDPDPYASTPTRSPMHGAVATR
ncbi:SAM-dependent methyltransferase [Micromonospora sp. KC721]|uniref:SAM-dependent methyltransferase n=1 Tax=Micromonospora sp. KC721 TaxID=2530380 RepID=UPI001FB5A2F7|nr:SAM-dependent methyltransferase [Micromonospora sp. KC721]